MSRPYSAGEVFTTAQLTPGPVTLAGGRYVFAQTFTGGAGSIALQQLGPDGINYQPVMSKTTTDTTGGTEIVLASLAVVRVVVTGVTGSAYSLSRVPTA